MVIKTNNRTSGRGQPYAKLWSSLSLCFSLPFTNCSVSLQRSHGALKKTQSLLITRLTNTLGLNEVMLFSYFWWWWWGGGWVALGNLDIENIPLFICSVPAKSFWAILGTAGCFIERASIHQGVMLDKSMKPRGMEDLGRQVQA